MKNELKARTSGQNSIRKFRYQEVHKIWRQTNGQTTLRQPSQTGDFIQSPALGLEHNPPLHRDSLSVDRRENTPRLAFEQIDPEPFLQRLDTAAERRLADTKASRCLAKIAGLNDSEEMPELLYFHSKARLNKTNGYHAFTKTHWHLQLVLCSVHAELSWIGSMKPIVHDYVRTSAGQVHCYVCGHGPLIVFLHWSPWDGRQYSGVLPGAAAAGYRGIAIDMLGSGQSDFAVRTMAGHAMVLDEVIESLGSPAAAIVGGHVGSGIALEYEIALPGKCQSIIFDGPAALSETDTIRMYDRLNALMPGYLPAGNERTYYTDFVLAILRIWDPQFELDEERRPIFESFLSASLMNSPEAKQAYPLHGYAMRERVQLMERSPLLLAAENDVLRPAVEWIEGALPRTVKHIYPGSHPLLSPARTGEYLVPILEFIGNSKIAV